jgi:RND family efflux transporter MFP subunit
MAGKFGLTATTLMMVTSVALSGCGSGGEEKPPARVGLSAQEKSAGGSAVGEKPAIGSEGEEKSEATAEPVVPVVRVEKRTLDRMLDLPGQLLAFQDVPLHSKVEGYISSISVDRGSSVHKGQVLIKVNAPEVDASVREAEAKESAAEAGYRQAVSAYQSIVSKQAESRAKLDADSLTWNRLVEAARTPGAIAQNEVDIQAKTVEEDKARADSLKAEIAAADQVVQAQKNNLKAAQHVVDSMKAMLAYLEIRAPFDGVITERNVHEGSIVSVSAEKRGESDVPLLRVQQKNLLRLVVAVPEACVSGCKVGEKISFSVPAFPGKDFAGRIARLGFALDQKTRTMPVELDVSNQDGQLEPGMFATVKWDVTRPYETLFVPATAVGEDLKGAFVIRVRDGVAERVTVTRGQQMGNLAEICGDLAEGEEVTLKATNEFKTGMHIAAKVADAEMVEKAARHSGAGGE